jgi:hypothetical protein
MKSGGWGWGVDSGTVEESGMSGGIGTGVRSGVGWAVA